MRKLTTLVLLALTVTLGLAVISPAASGAPPQGDGNSCRWFGSSTDDGDRVCSNQVPGSDGAPVAPRLLAAGTSQNGWPANSDATAIGVQAFTVPGTSPSRSLTVKSGVVSAILINVVRRFNSTVEPIGPNSSGYNYRVISGSSTLSNHSSGTAIDLNSDVHPQGSRGTFSDGQNSAIRAILALCGNTVVRWGGDYTGSTVDEMHFEINVPPADSRLPECATALAGGISVPSYNGVVRRDADGNLLWYRSYFDGITHGTPVKYGTAATDTPVTGDWNNDGTTDNGVVRRDPDGNLLWYRSYFDGITHGTPVKYGTAATDKPITGAW